VLSRLTASATGATTGAGSSGALSCVAAGAASAGVALAPSASARALETGSTEGGSMRSESRIFSASTSFSIVLRKSFEARRNSPIILPRLLPISGSFRGPKMIKATTKIRKSSGPPSVPNMLLSGSYHRACYSCGMPERWLGSAAGALACLLLAAAGTRAEIPIVELDGVVHAVSAAHVVQAIERADAQGAPLLVIRMDTPGGLDSSMRQIIDRMLNCRTPVAVFVGPSGAQASSAGFIIMVAADLAAMSPGTSTGAAHPVAGIGQMDEVMSKKVTSAMAAYIRSKAERRGRNVEMAEKAVVESKSFTEKEALELKLIDLVAKDVPDLLAQLEGRKVKRFDGTTLTLRLSGQKTVEVKMDWRQAILSAIARPEVLFLLLLGALAGLGAEISHPGLIFPGVLGTLCLILFLFASQIIPVSGAGVLLIVLAVALFVAEVKVASYGLLTVAGLVAMILGAMMLVDSELPELRVDPWTLLPVILVFAAFTIALVRLVLQSQHRKAQTGREGLLAQRGQAESDLAPEGWVRVQGERWRARASEPVTAGETIVVEAVEGLLLRVRKGA